MHRKVVMMAVRKVVMKVVQMVSLSVVQSVDRKEPLKVDLRVASMDLKTVVPMASSMVVLLAA